MTDQIVFLLQLVITGVAVGAVYSLMALGFVLIYKASTVVNFGPGELVLFGAYVAWATILNMKLPLYVALPLTLIVAVLLGLVTERGVLRPLIGQPIISVIMVTFGVASVIRGFLNMTWGSDTRPFPVLFSPEPFHLGPVPVSPVHLWSFVVVMALLAAFSVFFRFSLTGMAMRATADNQQGVLTSLGACRRNAGWSDEKGPAARRRPRAAREAYSLYVERAAEGANAADGPLSSLYGGSSNTSATDPYDSACTTLNDESRTSSAATSVTRSPIPMIHTRLA